MTQSQQNFRLIISYLIILLIPSALVRFFGLSDQFYLFTTITDSLGALLLLYFNYRGQKNRLEKHPLPLKKAIIWGISGILLALIIQIIAGSIDHLLFKNSTQSLNTLTLMTALKAQPWLIIILTIAAPTMEELVFRKAIFGGLSGRLNSVLAALISSLLFAVIHQDSHLIIYAAIGLFLCWLYRKTGSIYTTIISHAGMNLVVTLFYLSH
ncbi:CPBP family intramembrane metalloprotease [Latilactobacillus sakei]|uniref:CPBP family intramembrane glutamic endopeptidase n=1 Tax=Latilactobacillus sakei TaxID=1599 RepID=UPI0003402BA9|nr:type II CAAX endopeptidase family protein [Latilactobacillus sakei]EOR85497.1 CAAX family protease [Latilactobacillus sakei subsp. sakei LS25]PKX63017.1 CPBP family intramembrane metalloprotease [Latilactobacillus sakei]PKX67887.1 CPBP family intramembrane metalloprotease [Latilactobacillus sakei]